MAVEEERVDELIAVYKRFYDVELPRDEAREICERIAQLFEGLKRLREASEDSTSA